jgi:hypothetical protein
MHASIACLLLYEDYVWVSLGNAMKAKQSKAIDITITAHIMMHYQNRDTRMVAP